MAYFHCTGGVDVSDDTVTASTLLSGYTAHDKNGNAINGSMTNRGAVAPAKLNCGGSYTIPAGYHNGSGKVEVNTLASQTGVDSGKKAVTASTMQSGYQGWVNGTKVTGTSTKNADTSADTVTAARILSGYTAHNSAGTAITGSMANKGATNAGLAINGTYTMPAGYHNGSGKVTQSISTKAATTHYAATSSKTLVTAGYYCSGAQSLSAVTATNLSATNIKSGVTISVSNGSANLYSVAGSYNPATTPTLKGLTTSRPNNNYDYNETWTVPATGVVYFKWSFSDSDTSGYFVYRNGTLVSSARSGSFEVAMSANQTIRWGYTGAHATSDHYGEVVMCSMAVK